MGVSIVRKRCRCNELHPGCGEISYFHEQACRENNKSRYTLSHASENEPWASGETKSAG